MRASLEFGVDTATGSPAPAARQPLLDPWRANALDISYEKYFGEKAYVAAAFFYKDLKSYIYTQSIDNYDFSSFVADYVPPPGAHRYRPPARSPRRRTATAASCMASS